MFAQKAHATHESQQDEFASERFSTEGGIHLADRAMLELYLELTQALTGNYFGDAVLSPGYHEALRKSSTMTCLLPCAAIQSTFPPPPPAP